MRLDLLSGILAAGYTTLFGLPSQNSPFYFSQIDSSRLVTVPGSSPLEKREDFYSLNRATKPPVIGKSGWVPFDMVEHLMRNKKDGALGVKYEPGDEITLMDAAMHTFVTPVCDAVLTGDVHWIGKLAGHIFGQNQVRPIIMSAAIHPDFEFDNVVLPLIRLGQESVEGAEMGHLSIPDAEEKRNVAAREAYDAKLKRHMIYHLSPDHRLPAVSEIYPTTILSMDQAIGYLGGVMGRPLSKRPLFGLYARTDQGDVISLEVLFHIYLEQIRNEFKVLNPNTPQGYIYTISPPSIFSKHIGGAGLMNRLQALAMQTLHSENLFSSMHALAFNTYHDPEMVHLFQKALPNIRVMKMTDLYDAHQQYVGPAGLALVLHNNSDAFGQNIETEGPTSLDGVIGSYSDAALHFDRARADLLDYVF